MAYLRRAALGIEKEEIVRRVIDEPTSQLDPQGTGEVFKIIKAIRNSGKTIILVEHKIDLIAEHCDEVLVMEHGHIVFSGDTRNILSNMDLLKKGAEIPPVAIWGSEMKKAEFPLCSIPITVLQAVNFVKESNGGSIKNRW